VRSRSTQLETLEDAELEELRIEFRALHEHERTKRAAKDGGAAS
jgi:hypothetical protein